MTNKDQMLIKINHRLNRVIGQIKAIQKNIQEHPQTDCIDMVYQIKAARNALKKVSDVLIEQKIQKSININTSKMKNLKEAIELLSKGY